MKDIVNELPPFIARVGIFVDEDKNRVTEIAADCLLNMLQFHGAESAEYCKGFKGSYKVIKAFRMKDKSSLKDINDYDVDFFMLDTYSPRSAGGTGRVFNWSIISGFEFLKPVIISGGLTPGNVKELIEKVSPYGVDVSSGVEEAPGKKSLELMKEFVNKVRSI